MPHRKLKNKEENYTTGELIFKSPQGDLNRAYNNETKEEFLIKKSNEEFPSFSLMETFKKDYQFAKMLYQSYPEHFMNVIEMLEQKNGGVVLVAKEDGEGLQVFLEKKKHLDTQEFLKIGIEMTKALHFAHSKQIVHRNVKLANFVISSKSDSVKLIDFGLSVMVSRKSPSVLCTTPTGSFHYMSPEQTGKMSNNVDVRSDIYSLAISFYELLTGELPFEGDVLALVHAQITKKIPIVKNVPKVLNDLLQKMCAKNPTERYNSTLGVLNDLEYIQKHLNSIPDDFKIGQNDTREFQIPNKLYGREKELKWLKVEIMGAHKSHMCLVSGFAGMGKTKLVAELMKDQELNLMMSYGKFDQFNKLTPYSAFISAMRRLVSKVISDTEENKQKICHTLKQNLKKELGGVFFSVLPEVEHLIGKQEIPKPLASIQDTQERLFESFINFLKAFAHQNKLVLVLDDLQWADAASFDFLEKLLKMKKENIFIIGAYRDNEVDDNHPLSTVIQQHDIISILELQPLKIEHLNEMVSNTFLKDPESTKELSELIYKKTLGNPFFSREFINVLYQDKLVSYENGSWEWDVKKVEKMNFSSNVIDFMIVNLKKQPKTIQKLLNRAACIGNTFKLDELELIWKEEETDLEMELMNPLKEGWIEQLNSNEYKFYHDRLQQAAYELYKNEEAKEIHLVIGNALLEEFTTNNTVENHIFEIINHLNKAKSIFPKPKELLKLNLLAARKSIQNSAFSSSLDFSLIALDMLPPNAWETDYDLAFETHSAHANSFYVNAMLKESEEEYNILLEKAAGRYDKLKVYANFMNMAALSNQFNKAYDLFITALKMFELTKDIPYLDEKKLMIWTLDLKKKIDEEVKKIGGMRNILNLNTMSKDFALLMKIMFESLDIVYIASNALSLMYVVNSMVGLFINITRGLSDNSSASLAAAGFCYSFFFKDKAGYELTLVAEQLLSSKKNDENDNFVTTQFHLGIGNMTGGTFKQIKYHMESAIKYAMNHGDFTFGCYSIMHGSESMIFNGANFQKMLSKLQHYQVWLKKIKNVFVSDFMEAMIHFVSDLSDISTFNPKFVLPVDFKCLDTFIPTIEGILRYHKGEFEVALKLFEAAEPVIDHEQGLVDYYEMKFYHCLTLTHVYKTSKDPKHSKRIEEYIKEFKVLSDISPGYLEPRYKLMDLFYRSLTSTDHLMFANDFEEIAESSKNLGLLMIEAVILEILLAFCDDNKFPKAICRLYFNATLEIWKDLSASAKVDQLTKKYYKYISLMSSRRTSGNQSTSSFFSSTSSTNSSIEEIDGNFF